MYCLQVNKLLQPLQSKKSSFTKTKSSFYVVLTYDNQKRRTTCKQPDKNNNVIWYESFLFVIDNNKNKNIKLEIFDKNNSLLVSENISYI